MRKLVAASSLVLAGCSAEPAYDNTAGFDVNAAAARAEGDIANYAAGTKRARTPRASAPMALAAVPSTNTVAEVPVDTGSVQGAADVVQRYYALIGEAKYTDAWALWRDGGGASGMTEAAFAASFDKYADYHAEVGAPGDADAGAGQVYITVPVRLYGSLKKGGQFAMAGSMTLHRVNDGIDTSDPTEHAWRIDKSDIKPRPNDVPNQPPRSPAPPDPPA